MAKPYDPKDFYYRKAKKEGLRARSAFKIDEILRRHRLLRKGQAVLDLGAAPGGFLQILAEEVGETGVAVGVDLEPIRRLGKPWVKTAVVDLLAPEGYGEITGGSERIWDGALLEERVSRIGIPREAYAWYLDLRRFGSVPHSGFGIGIERTVAWICGLQHIRETIPYARMLNRKYP